MTDEQQPGSRPDPVDSEPTDATDDDCMVTKTPSERTPTKARNALPPTYFARQKIRKEIIRPKAERIAIYCRNSQFNENENSIDRQVRSGEEYIESIGGQRAPHQHIFVDEEKSGAFLDGRDGLAELGAAVSDRQIDGVFVERISRLGRDLGDLGVVYRHFNFHRVDVHTSDSGRIGLGHVVFQGLAAQEERDVFLKRRQATMDRLYEEGRMIAACLPYGYRRVDDGAVEIDPDAAPIVLEIFQAFAAGKTLRSIACDLNRRGVHARDGGTWSGRHFLKFGPKQGLLTLEIFKGLYVGRRFVCEPVFGRKKYVLKERDRSDAVVIEVPHLAIVPQQLFETVQKLISAREKLSEMTPRRDRKNYFLSGFVRCGCGAKMSYLGRSDGLYLFCTSTISGLSHPSAKLPARFIEAEMLSILRDEVLAGKVVTECNTHLDATSTARQQAASDRARSMAIIERLKSNLRESFEASIRAETTSATVAAMRTGWIEDLEREEFKLETLPVPAEPTARDPKHDAALRMKIDNQLARLRSGQSMETDQTLDDFIHKVVDEIVVEPGGPGKSCKLVVMMRMQTLVGDGVPELRTCERLVPTNWYFTDPALAARIKDLAASGVLALTDAEWAFVADVFGAARGIGSGKNHVPVRELAHAALFSARTSVPVRRLPRQFGATRALQSWLERFGRDGRLRHFIERLQANGVDKAEGLDPAHFETPRNRSLVDRLAAVAHCTRVLDGFEAAQGSIQGTSEVRSAEIHLHPGRSLSDDGKID